MRIKRPDQVWSTDIIHVRLVSEFMFVAAILDWFHHYVLAWLLSKSLEGSFCQQMLEEALGQRRCLNNVFAVRLWRMVEYEAVPQLQRRWGRYFPYSNEGVCTGPWTVGHWRPLAEVRQAYPHPFPCGLAPPGKTGDESLTGRHGMN